MNISVNGMAVDVSRWPSSEVAAVRELLRQRAVARGFLLAEADGHEEIETAIEHLLAEEVQVPTPTETETQRYYEAHRKEFQSGDLVHVRHILFQVTPGVDVAQLRSRAEQTLAELLQSPERFEAVARDLSNCPSGQQGGNLGQISRGDTVPEFERALFRLGPTGILGEVVKTRHGFHIVAVDQRIPGETLPFEAVRKLIADRLTATVEERALRQYISILAGQAEIVGVDLQGTKIPLVQ
jgi:peptidyl-prolyl cis-trans isomerase C